MTRYYLAPLEGITTHIFRNAYHRHFCPMDKYFTPFLVPHSKKGFSARERREILPENNEGLYLVPQIMSNHAGDCLKTVGKLQAYGYKEINLNMGCPSKTVVSKGRGSGFLAFPEELDRFLDEVFAGIGNTDVQISIKTRLGKEEPEEFYDILEIYNRYPLKELIIHPRVQKDFYKNEPDLKIFACGQEGSKSPVCYNGDIFTAEKCEELRQRFPEVRAFMLGRGILMDPLLLERIKQEAGDGRAQAEKFWRFHDQLYEDYRALGMGDKNVLFKMKELWCYLGQSFPGREKTLKKIRKAERLDRYEAAVEELL
ncbi:MAG: tRNA-dihydrouridine synthase family protein [Dorea sp.]|nr:tRNA-dihydrouridine synthase family protein [Dorea sp.]